MHLFVADDNQDFAEFCVRVAKPLKWTSTICRNGLELIEALPHGGAPALLLVDINMPVMDGIEVVHSLPSIERPLRLRFVTGGPDASALAARMMAEVRDLSVGRYLTKPIGLADLRAVFEEEAGILRRLEKVA